MAGQGNYDVDIVMCIDGTGSMGPIIEEVKSNAMSMHEKFEEAMCLAGKDPAGARIKVIVFGDYKSDPEPMQESPFFALPDQNDEFRAFVQGIRATGGGDIPENAFEAIATAMKSDWTPAKPGIKRRQAIVVFSDAPALPLGERADCGNYPTDIPKTMPELSAWWEGTTQSFGGSYDPKAGRLVAFVPNDETWTQLESWNRFTPAYTAGKGCSELDMQTILDTIVGSFDM
ncbi:MAG: VWA domain-containing protein [Ruminococcaceae bacterium]|nr:VWA domain-containing protein [Oscillospiraceae bacterium]